MCRDVTVYRLLTEGTIEEGMHHCALKKLKLERDITEIGGWVEVGG